MPAAIGRHRTASDLARVLAAWLVVVLLVQAHAALWTLVRGPAHRHAPAPAAATPGEWQPVLTALAHHGIGAPEAGRLGDALETLHRLAHERGDVHHHHSVGAVALPAEGATALDTAACALMAALAPLAMHFAWPTPLVSGEAPVASPGWALLEQDLAPPRRPPRG